jgi:hypothetical protein
VEEAQLPLVEESDCSKRSRDRKGKEKALAELDPGFIDPKARYDPPSPVTWVNQF